MRKVTVWLLGLIIVCGVAVSDSRANPPFARQNDLKCAACHGAWPNLNAFGREFKENGFRLEPGALVPAHVQDYGNKTWLEKVPFVGGKINGRPHDKTKGADSKFRVFHELELFLSGSASNNFSFNVTAEAEDEVLTDDEDHIELFLDQIFVGWHPMQYANLVAGYAPIFAADPYNSLSSGNRRVTRSAKAPLSGTFASGFSFVEPTQFLTFYGRASGFYYSATIGTGNDDPEGEDDTDALVRLAYDIPVFKSEGSESGLAVGGLYLDGSNKDTFGPGLDQSYSRTGIDFNIDVGNFQAYGLWLDTKADVTPGLPEVSNTSSYIEALYVFQNDERPILYPLVRWESVESNNGNDSTDGIAILLGGYVRQNINLNLEYYKQTDVPAGGTKSSRVTLFFNIGI